MQTAERRTTLSLNQETPPLVLSVKTSIFKNINFVKHVQTAAFVYKPTLTYPANISTSDQRCFNVKITLIWCWKWNKIRRRIFNFAQRWYNVSARRWNNVETTLHNVGTTLIQRCFNLASTLVKTILNPIGLVMIMDLQIHE